MSPALLKTSRARRFAEAPSGPCGWSMHPGARVCFFHVIAWATSRTSARPYLEKTFEAIVPDQHRSHNTSANRGPERLEEFSNPRLLRGFAPALGSAGGPPFQLFDADLVGSSRWLDAEHGGGLQHGPRPEPPKRLSPRRPHCCLDRPPELLQ
jgi:hypothetical protein